MACLLSLLLGLLGQTDAAATDDGPAVAPGCLDELAAFATSADIAFDRAAITFGPRWVGAGHEIKRLPGLRVKLPVERCGATLALDLSPDCRIVRSRGEKGCKAAFPLSFH